MELASPATTRRLPGVGSGAYLTRTPRKAARSKRPSLQAAYALDHSRTKKGERVSSTNDWAAVSVRSASLRFMSASEAREKDAYRSVRYAESVLFCMRCVPS